MHSGCSACGSGETGAAAEGGAAAAEGGAVIFLVPQWW